MKATDGKNIKLFCLNTVTPGGGENPMMFDGIKSIALKKKGERISKNTW